MAMNKQFLCGTMRAASQQLQCPALLRTEAGGADQYFWKYFTWSRFIYLALVAVSALYLLLLFTPLAVHLPLVSPPLATPVTIGGHSP